MDLARKARDMEQSPFQIGLPDQRLVDSSPDGAQSGAGGFSGLRFASSGLRVTRSITRSALAFQLQFAGPNAIVSRFADCVPRITCVKLAPLAGGHSGR